MQNSTLIKLLKTLEKKELRQFKKEYIKKNAANLSIPQRIFSLIYNKGNHPHYDSIALTKEKVCKVLFPNMIESSAKQNLSVQMGFLRDAIKDFLLKLETEKSYGNFLLLKSLYDRKAFGEFLTTYDKIKDNRESINRTIEYYHEQYLLEELVYKFKLSNPNLSKEIDINYSKVLNTFETYVFLTKIQYHCIIWTQIAMKEENQGIKLTKNLIDKIKSTKDFIDTIKAKELFKDVLVNFYYLNLLLLIEKDNKTYFDKLEKAMKENTLPIGTDELDANYTMAANYCSHEIRKGDIDFEPKMFEIYKLMAKYKTPYENNYIRDEYVKNIIGLGLHLKETGWVNKFIEEIKDDIAPEYRESLLAFNNAVLYFDKGNYENAHDMLNNIEHKKASYKLNYKSFLLKCYYMKNETIALKSLIESFPGLIKYQKDISQRQKKSYLNFVTHVSRLKKAKYPEGKYKLTKNKIKKIEEAILKASPINNKRWLLDMVEELKKTKGLG